jgi:hypothetical protein
VEKVRVTYEKGAGDAGGLHTWTYYFDSRSARLTANHLNYGPTTASIRRSSSGWFFTTVAA